MVPRIAPQDGSPTRLNIFMSGRDWSPVLRISNLIIAAFHHQAHSSIGPDGPDRSWLPA
jgi:hypothetical protein